MENNFMQIIKTRRSCRHYRDEQVDDQLLNSSTPFLRLEHTLLQVMEHRTRRLWLCRILL